MFSKNLIVLLCFVPTDYGNIYKRFHLIKNGSNDFDGHCFWEKQSAFLSIAACLLILNSNANFILVSVNKDLLFLLKR